MNDFPYELATPDETPTPENHELPTNPGTHSSDKQLLLYTGSAGGIYKVWIKNLLLMIVTFTIYRAWAKVRIRKYLWANVQIDSDALRYTGTGGEIFRGYMKVGLLFFIIPLLITIGANMLLADKEQRNYSQEDLNVIYDTMAQCGYNRDNWDQVNNRVFRECMRQHHKTQYIHQNLADDIADFASMPLFIYLFYFSRYSALRYRLSRTTWRGIRGRLTGKANGYVWLSLYRLLLNIVTLGILIPKSDIVKQHYLMKDMYLGSQQASFEQNSDGLMKTHIISWILALPTLLIARLWYRAALSNKKLHNLSFGDVHFHGSYTGRKYAGFYIINLLLIVCTFGLGIPLVVHRTIKFHIENTHMTGNIAASHILQASSDAGNFGEGFADSYDGGIDVDFGFI